MDKFTVQKYRAKGRKLQQQKKVENLTLHRETGINIVNLFVEKRLFFFSGYSVIVSIISLLKFRFID